MRERGREKGREGEGETERERIVNCSIVRGVNIV